MENYQTYVQILKEELVPAMGCTEPIALAYCAAVAKKTLNLMPTKVLVEVSGNILKNVKSVVVPNTNGHKGIQSAVAAGIIYGHPELVLEVISKVTEEEKAQLDDFLERTEFEIRSIKSDEVLDIVISLFCKDEYAKVRVARSHSHVAYVEHNGEVVYQSAFVEAKQAELADRKCLSVEKIVAFANEVNLDDVKEVLQRQIDYNTAIALEGLKNPYGANVGKVLLHHDGDSIRVRARAMAAAGSDARMSGCELPVVINSGSGNQGMTTSLPVIEYAKELNATKEQLLRALVVSNLITIHLKTGIGRLSAYCGVTCAGAGAAAGIAHLHGEGFDAIAHTIVNTLAILSGMICDGAKPSCAGKIASAVEAGLLGYQMYLDGQQFYGGDGIVSKGVENTISNIGRLGCEGMKETDEEIIRIMLSC